MKSFDEFDRRVRALVFNELMTVCKAPTPDAVSRTLNASLDDVRSSFQRLASARVFILQTDGDVMAANPFANIPTPFVVESGARRWTAMCIWDSLGIPAMLDINATIYTTCGDCNDAIELDVGGRTLRNSQAVVHFAIPAKHWWDNIVFT